MRPPSATMERRDIIIIVAVISVVVLAGLAILGWLVWDFLTCDCKIE